MPTRHAYLLKPGQPTPGLHNFLRPHIASRRGTGILTCFPSATPFGLALGADSPCADERGAGNLGLTACGLFTRINATHVSSRTSDTSREPYDSPSQAYGTLPYHHVLAHGSAASADSLSPVTSSARENSTSELLRMAASKPTSWLFMPSHLVSHLAIAWGP